jgi:hypothetical protein
MGGRCRPGAHENPFLLDFCIKSASTRAHTEAPGRTMCRGDRLSEHGQGRTAPGRSCPHGLPAGFPLLRHRKGPPAGACQLAYNLPGIAPEICRHAPAAADQRKGKPGALPIGDACPVPLEAGRGCQAPEICRRVRPLPSGSAPAPGGNRAPHIP